MAEKQFLTTLKFVEEVAEVIENEQSKEQIAHLVESIRNADGLEVDKADEERKIARLNFNARSLAEQAVFTAFSEGNLNEDLEKKFRELTPIADMQAAAVAAEESVKSEEKAISDQMNTFRERAKKFDLMVTVCNGRSAKEAKQMQKAYEKQAAQMKG